MMSLLLLIEFIFLSKVAISTIHEMGNCYECMDPPEGFYLCCDDGSTTTTTTSTTTTTTTTTSTTTVDTTNLETTVVIESTANPPDTTTPITTEVPTTTTSPPDTTASTTEDPIDPVICKHWSSSRFSTFSDAGGAPLDVCFGAFGGAEISSTSYIYKCSDDNSTVEQWWYTGSSDCNEETATTSYKLNTFLFDPTKDSDTFECRGDPCPYYIIEDGTAHPTQTCPFDLGKEYPDEDDYATWQLKLILSGCQSFDGQTSLLTRCSESNGGITLYSFNNPTCDVSGLVGSNQAFESGTIVCNYGTGRSVYCFDGDDDDDDDDDATTATPTTGGSGGSAGSTTTASKSATSSLDDPLVSHAPQNKVIASILVMLAAFILY